MVPLGPAGAAYPAGAQEGRHLRFPPSCESPLFPWRVWRRLPTCDRCEIRERQRIFSSVSFATCSQGQIHYCYTGGLLYAGATCPCRAIRKSGDYGRHLRIKRLVQFILAGAVYNNALKDRATRVCRACADLTVCVAVRCL